MRMELRSNAFVSSIAIRSMFPCAAPTATRIRTSVSFDELHVKNRDRSLWCPREPATATEARDQAIETMKAQVAARKCLNAETVNLERNATRILKI